MVIDLEIYSDVVCPWCFVGKRRMEKAEALIKGRHEIKKIWRPFELNPGMPPEGKDRKSYLAAKFGGQERLVAMDQRMALVGDGEGIAFAQERMKVVPNTFDAHRLIWNAGKAGHGEAMAETLFRAYFLEGTDIGDGRVLSELGVHKGMDAKGILAWLESDIGVAEVRAEEQRGLDLGIGGVPFYVANGKLALEGAQDVDSFVAFFESAGEIN